MHDLHTRRAMRDALQQLAAVMDQTEAALIGLSGKIPDVEIGSEIKRRIVDAFDDLRADTTRHYTAQMNEDTDWRV